MAWRERKKLNYYNLKPCYKILVCWLLFWGQTYLRVSLALEPLGSNPGWCSRDLMKCWRSKASQSKARHKCITHNALWPRAYKILVFLLIHSGGLIEKGKKIIFAFLNTYSLCICGPMVGGTAKREILKKKSKTYLLVFRIALSRWK